MNIQRVSLIQHLYLVLNQGRSSYTSIQATKRPAIWNNRGGLIDGAQPPCVASCFGSMSGLRRFSGTRDSAQPPGKTAPPRAGPPLPQRRLSSRCGRPAIGPISIDNIRLDLRVDLEKKTVEGQATISFHCVRPTRP